MTEPEIEQRLRERWFHCNLDYACFGFASLDGVVIKAAPIFQWAVGKTLEDIKPFLIRKKAVVTEIKQKT